MVGLDASINDFSFPFLFNFFGIQTSFRPVPSPDANDCSHRPFFGDVLRCLIDGAMAAYMALFARLI